MKRFLLAVLMLLVSSNVLAQTSASERAGLRISETSVSKVKNQTQDADLEMCVNDGGVEKCLTLDGPTADVEVPGKVKNSNQDENLDFCVNDGGTERCARLEGTTGVFTPLNGFIIDSTNIGQARQVFFSYSWNGSCPNASTCDTLEITNLGGNAGCLITVFGNRGSTSDLFNGMWLMKKRLSVSIRITQIAKQSFSGIGAIDLSTPDNEKLVLTQEAGSGGGGAAWDLSAVCTGMGAIPTFTVL